MIVGSQAAVSGGSVAGSMSGAAVAQKQDVFFGAFNPQKESGKISQNGQYGEAMGGGSIAADPGKAANKIESIRKSLKYMNVGSTVEASAGAIAKGTEATYGEASTASRILQAAAASQTRRSNIESLYNN